MASCGGGCCRGAPITWTTALASLPSWTITSSLRICVCAQKGSLFRRSHSILGGAPSKVTFPSTVPPRSSAASSSSITSWMQPSSFFRHDSVAFVEPAEQEQERRRLAEKDLGPALRSDHVALRLFFRQPRRLGTRRQQAQPSIL